MVRKLSQEAAGQSNLTPAAFIDWLRGVTRLETDYKEKNEEAKAAQALFRNEVKRGYKDLGVPKEAFGLLMRLRKLDSDEASLAMKGLHRLGVFLNMPLFTQSDLFAPPPTTEQMSAEIVEEAARIDAEQTGYYRGVAGDTQDENPHPGGQAVHVAWHAGWKRGNEFLMKSKAASGDDAAQTKPVGRRSRGNPALPLAEAAA